jgi:hypothetical protein
MVMKEGGRRDWKEGGLDGKKCVCVYVCVCVCMSMEMGVGAWVGKGFVSYSIYNFDYVPSK